MRGATDLLSRLRDVAERATPVRAPPSWKIAHKKSQQETSTYARNAVFGFYEIIHLADGSKRDRGSRNIAPMHCRLLTTGDGDNELEWNGHVCGWWYYLEQQELFCLIFKAGGPTKTSLRHVFEKVGDTTWNLLGNGHGAYAELEGLRFFDKNLDTRNSINHTNQDIGTKCNIELILVD